MCAHTNSLEAEDEDLICDAVEQTEEKDLTSFKGSTSLTKIVLYLLDLGLNIIRGHSINTWTR